MRTAASDCGCNDNFYIDIGFNGNIERNIRDITRTDINGSF